MFPVSNNHPYGSPSNYIIDSLSIYLLYLSIWSLPVFISMSTLIHVCIMHNPHSIGHSCPPRSDSFPLILSSSISFNHSSCHRHRSSLAIHNSLTRPSSLFLSISLTYPLLPLRHSLSSLFSPSQSQSCSLNSIHRRLYHVTQLALLLFSQYCLTSSCPHSSPFFLSFSNSSFKSLSFLSYHHLLSYFLPHIIIFPHNLSSLFLSPNTLHSSLIYPCHSPSLLLSNPFTDRR